MIHYIWCGIMVLSIVYGRLKGMENGIVEAALDGCGKAVAFTMHLCAGYMFFCGLMEVVRALKAERLIQRAVQPFLRRLMPNLKAEKAMTSVTMNLAMNMLGLGNAATPMGLEAMRQMDAERVLHPEVRHDMYMLLILNATSLQLLPTTVLTMRIAAGSANANAILLPTLLCTAVSTIVGAALGVVCRRKGSEKDV